MERGKGVDAGYEGFLEFGRHLARLQAAVYETFGMHTSGRIRMTGIDDAWDSYVQLPDDYSAARTLSRHKLYLHDKVLDFVPAPDEMDWQDFSELVHTVIDLLWERIESDADGTYELLLSAV